MSSERAVPFASKPPEGWDDHVEVMRATRMFLLQTKGPTRFVVRGEESDRKFTVLVGSRARCSCGVSLCLHHLFVMLKVLKVQPTNPLAWQIALIDSEVDSILGDDGFGRHNHSGAPPPPGPCRKFLRRGAGRTSAGGGGSSKATGGDDAEGGGGGVGDGGGTRRLAIVPGEVCPVCQEEMEDEGDGGDVGGAREVAMEGKLTYCRGGCGNNMHARCMLMYAEHRRSSGDKPCCPLCRVDWGVTAVRALREVAIRLQGREGKGGGRLGRGGGNERNGAAVSDAASTRAALVPVTCRSCSVKVQAAFFRCLVCGPAGSWDLCRRCYAMSGVRRSSNGGSSSCTPVGRRKHPFVQGDAAIDPPEWKPAEPPGHGRRRGGARGSGAAPRTNPAVAGVLSLQDREITTADFELLLTLDASPVCPLHEHLLRSLPPYHPTDVSAAAAAGGVSLRHSTALLAQRRPGASSEPPSSMVRQLRRHAPPLPSPEHEGEGYSVPPASLPLGSLAIGQTGGDLDGGVVENARGGGGRGSEGSPLTASGSLSPPARRTTVVAELMHPSSNISSRSLSGLVAAAAMARRAAAEVTVPASASAARALAGPPELEATTVSETAQTPDPLSAPAPAPALAETGGWDAPAEANSRVSSTVPSFPPGERAPVSGSFASEPVSCSCCSDIGSTGASVGRGSDHSAETHLTRSAGALRTGRWNTSDPPASSPSMRRLSCGHSAHESCLIPLVLESVGRGDPYRCRCPLDSTPIFPVLSRRHHRRRARRSRPGTDEGASMTSAAAASATRDDHRNGTRSAPSATVPPARRTGESIDRHARAAAAREALRRSAVGCGGGAGGGGVAADALGIMLVGSGLAHATSRPPPPPPAGGTRSIALRRGPRTRETGRTDRNREDGFARCRAAEHESEERQAVGKRAGDREVGGRGRSEVSSTGHDTLASNDLIFGGGGMLNGARGGSGARGEPGVDGVSIGDLPRSRQRRGFPRVARGSTISSGGNGGREVRLGRFTSCGALDRDEHGAASAGGAVEGLSLTSFSVASSNAGGVEEDAKKCGTRHLSLSRTTGEEVTTNKKNEPSAEVVSREVEKRNHLS